MKPRNLNLARLVTLLALVAAPVSINASPLSQDSAVKSTDQTVDARIERRLSSDASLKNYHIGVSVDEKVATLTGTVATAKQKARAAELANVAGVTRVDNRLVLDPSAGTTGTAGTVEKKTRNVAEKTADAVVKGVTKAAEGVDIAVDKTKSALSKSGETITDGWITTQVSSSFVDEDLLSGSDINVDTANHVVTLKGTVTTSAGRAKAIEVAKRTEGVRQVKSLLTIGPKR